MKNINRTRFYRIFLCGAWKALLLVCSLGPAGAQAQELLRSPGSTASRSNAPVSATTDCRIIYLGFVGALEPPNNKYSGVVQIREALQGREFADVCANSFSPYTFAEGRNWLLKHFPSHAGELTPVERRHSPKVILVGHSMGGWAVISLARELRGRDIPVELTIQVDSVGITDHTVPANVKSAAIFHANDWIMFLTTKHLKREDSSHTHLVADINVAGAGHESITRDPRIRELVMGTIESLRAGFTDKPMSDPGLASTAAASKADQQ